MPPEPLSQLPGFVPVPADGVYTREWLERFFGGGDRNGFIGELQTLAAEIASEHQNESCRVQPEAERHAS